MTQFSTALSAIRKSAPGQAVATLHVAIIMDGNGRWARARGLPGTMAHRRGVEAARKAIRGAAEAGVTHLTLFGFSSENWKRPRAEVQYLMGLLRNYLQRNVDELHEAGVRLSVIGERDALPVLEVLRLGGDRSFHEEFPSKFTLRRDGGGESARRDARGRGRGRASARSDRSPRTATAGPTRRRVGGR